MRNELVRRAGMSSVHLSECLQVPGQRLHSAFRFSSAFLFFHFPFFHLSILFFFQLSSFPLFPFPPQSSVSAFPSPPVTTFTCVSPSFVSPLCLSPVCVPPSFVSILCPSPVCVSPPFGDTQVRSAAFPDSDSATQTNEHSLLSHRLPLSD